MNQPSVMESFQQNSAPWVESTCDYSKIVTKRGKQVFWTFSPNGLVFAACRPIPPYTFKHSSIYIPSGTSIKNKTISEIFNYIIEKYFWISPLMEDVHIIRKANGERLAVAFDQSSDLMLVTDGESHIYEMNF